MVFSQPGRTEKIWQQLQVEHYWGHHDRPKGQRFLGSIRIPRDRVGQLLDEVDRSLAQVRPFTFAELEERFGWHDPQKYWIKLITLALSEYAYYDEGNTGFWEGVCDLLKLENTQGVQNALRAILDQGFRLLGLVETQQHNRYVSTLWLQSGIPQQNLRHFAQLLQEIFQKYGWWEIIHAEPEGLSQMIYDDCKQSHPQWGKLLRFLESSYAKEGEAVEPISGQLIQGIAIVAQELERRGQSPTILQDSHQREQVLQSFCLPSNFFLRSWDNLTQVLTPQTKSHTTGRSIIGLRKKPLLLVLDVVDSMDIQLCLPEQHLYHKDWKDLNRTHCNIQETNWEGDIGLSSGIVAIPKQSQSVENVQSSWTWHLRSHTDISLTEWHCEGVSQNFPVLIFDAWTGDRLIFTGELKGSIDIICFFASDTQLELSNGVELLDGLVPCSIAGWRGQQLHLTAAQAQLTFRLPNSIQILEWNQLQAEHPQLRGLKLKGKQSVHLEVPAVWYPPLKLGKSVNILVEDLTNRTILTALDATVTLPANSNWQCFRLSQWITQSGSYAVRLWNQVDRTSTAAEADRWSERFEVRSGFELSQPSNMSALVVCDRSQTPLETSGQAASPEDFWLEEITLRGLWALEEIKILLTNGKETQSYRQQASPSGVLAINLAAWRDVLPESDWYALSYQRQGEDLQRLLEMGSGETVSHTWTNQALHLSGLQPGRSYSLVLWNVLAPQNSLPPQSVVSLPNQKTVTVPLVDLFGIFYVQIESSMQFAQSLGWWCGIQEIANLSLSDELSGDLFEYCMNVFENESVEIFLTEIQRLNLDFDAEAIKQAIAALENLPCHLPNWLDRDLFRQKLQVFLESPDNPEAEIGAEQQEISISPQVNSPAIVSINGHTVTPPQQGRWYLVTIRPNNNSQSIFSGELRRRDNRHLIERCEISSCHEYQQYILIKTSNFSSETLELIRQTPCFQKIERRPLSLNQVTRMLGVNPDAA